MAVAKGIWSVGEALLTFPSAWSRYTVLSSRRSSPSMRMKVPRPRLPFDARVEDWIPVSEIPSMRALRREYWYMWFGSMTESYSWDGSEILFDV